MTPPRSIDERVVSARHALTTEELDFCRRYLAFGEKNATEAYRRAFYYVWNEDKRKYVESSETPPFAKTVQKQATSLLKKEVIQAYLAELRTSPASLSRELLADQVRFGDERVSAKAAERILEDEDKLGIKDAAERWAEVLCDVGAEVVVPLGGTARVPYTCFECGHEGVVEYKPEAVVPLAELFPRHAARTDD